jgi:hypothetical protein
MASKMYSNKTKEKKIFRTIHTSKRKSKQDIETEDIATGKNERLFCKFAVFTFFSLCFWRLSMVLRKIFDQVEFDIDLL